MTAGTAGSGRPDSLLTTSPAFRRYWTARTVSMAGSAVSGTLLPLLVYQTSRSASLTSFVSVALVAPFPLFGFVAGAAADRVDAKRVLLACDLICTVAIGAIPVAHALSVLTPGFVYLATFASATAVVWFDAASFGTLLALAGRDRIGEANSLVWSSYSVVRAVGPAAAGLLAGWLGTAGGITVDAASYLASFGLVLTIPGTVWAGRAAPAAGRAERRLRAEIAEGLAYLWRKRLIRVFTLCAAANGFTGGAVFGLLVVYSARRLGHAGGGAVGLLFAAGGLGAVLGSVLTRDDRLAVIRRRVVTALLAAFLLALLLSVVTSYLLALVVYLGWNGTQLSITVNTITARQKIVPSRLQGRVNTTGRMIAYGCTPLGAAAGGLLADRTGVPVAIAACAGVTGLVWVYATLVLGGPRILLTGVPRRRLSSG
ncbi:MAG: MFS transporter [Mycobacteriales bacterium]